MVALQDAVRHIEDAPFVQLYLPGERTDMIHRHRVTEDFVQAPQVFLPGALWRHSAHSMQLPTLRLRLPSTAAGCLRLRNLQLPSTTGQLLP